MKRPTTARRRASGPWTSARWTTACCAACLSCRRLRSTAAWAGASDRTRAARFACVRLWRVARACALPCLLFSRLRRRLYDYGPPGCALRENVIAAWKSHFLLEEGILQVRGRAAARSSLPQSKAAAAGHLARARRACLLHTSGALSRHCACSSAPHADRVHDADAARRAQDVRPRRQVRRPDGQGHEDGCVCAAACGGAMRGAFCVRAPPCPRRPPPLFWPRRPLLAAQASATARTS